MATPNTDGIDSSHHQDLTGAPLPELTFAIQKVSQGPAFRDPDLKQMATFYRTSPQVKHVGFYHYMDDAPAGAQVLNFIKTFEETCGYLLPGEFFMVDWERFTYKDRTGFAKRSEVAAFITVLTEYLKGKGYKDARNRIVMYSAPWVPGFTLWRVGNPLDPFIYPNYNLSGKGSGWIYSKILRADVWQWTSTLRLAAFTGNVDGNHILNWSYFDWLART
jgi:hypothetical protein